MSEFQCVVPILNVSNFAVSVDYYVNKLGFEKKWAWGEPPTFGCVARGKVEIFFCEGGQGQPGMWLSIFVDDVMLLYNEYQKSGAKIKEPPKNFPWGLCEFLVEDPDGHVLRLGSERTGPDDAAWQNTARRG
jgi:catechol 2,3-dioxygenase-like lactoylglutathione lyase family enzyme